MSGAASAAPAGEHHIVGAVIRTGMGGWTFAPWRGVFYPDGLRQADELDYAAAHVGAIEINGTFYGRQKPATWEKWAKAVPDGFVFALKASRYCVTRRILAEAGESIGRFLDQGLVRLEDRLGPILWQFAATRAFDREDFARFLALLPAEWEGRALRHVVEPRHESFADAAFVDLVRDHGVAIAVADSPRYPQFADPTADFVYARLQAGQDDEPTCYPPAAIAHWAGVAQAWRDGGRPEGLRYVTDAAPAAAKRDVFAFFINGGKVNAPAGARALAAAIDPA